MTIERHKNILLEWARHDYSKRKASEELDIPWTSFRRYLDQAIHWATTTPLGKRWSEQYGIEVGENAGAENVDVQVKVLLDKIRKLQKELQTAREESLEAQSIREGIFELSRQDPIEPDWVHNRSRYQYEHGVPTLMLSDIHLGEVVYANQVMYLNDFDTDVCIRRIHKVADKTIHLLNDVLGGPYPGIVLVLGGDMINGMIHEELAIGSDRTFMEQIIEVADVIHQVILKFEKAFGRVYVTGVPGNHGRTTRKPFAKFNAGTNVDWLTYQMLERFLRGHENIVFNCPPARDVTYRVAGRRFRLTHGDQFRGGDGMIGFLGPVTRGKHKKQSHALSMPFDDEQFDTLIMGHFHSLHMTPNLIVNGSIKGYDEYAVSNSFQYEPPQQALFLTHADYGINHFMPVLADEPRVRDKVAWVEWQVEDVD